MNHSNAIDMDRTKLTERIYHIGIWTCLVTALVLIFLLATSYRANAQWSNDPTAPMVVSNATNAQRYMKAIADADSGYYVFWSDLRNDANKADLYGQHFDSEGNALWAANGELLLSNPIKSINQVAPLRMPDGSVIVAYMTGSTNVGADTVRAMRFDANANAIWTEPSILLTGLDFRSVQVVASDSCAYVVAYCESCGGGGYGCKMQRVRMNGTVQFTLPGGTTGSGYFGPYTIHPDGAGGVLFTIRASNGAGTSLKAQRFDSLGTAVWPNYIDLADASGLQYAFSTTMDDTGALTAVWEVAAADLRMHRLDTLGNSLWSPAVQVACDLAVHVQDDPSTLAIGNELFVAWSDSRPPAALRDMYIQKYDLASGAELWATDGVPAIQTNTYIPKTGLVASDSGGVVVTFDGNIAGYSAMRIRNDGTQAWPDPVVFCVPSFNPFNERRVHLSDGNGGVVAFWESSAGDVYGARVYRNGKLYNDVGVSERDDRSTITAFPNPAQERISFDLPAGARILRVELIDVLGAVIIPDVAGSTILIGQLAQGAYTARLHTANRIFTSRFIKN